MSSSLDGGTGYKPPFSIYSMTVCFVSVYETLWGANLSQKKKNEIFQQMFRRIEGSYSEEDGQERDPSFFPSVLSNDESVSGHDFLEGTLLLPFLEQCPLMMAPLLASLRATPSHSRSQLAQECVLAGYADGDGSFYAQFDGEANPALSIALKDSQRHIDHGDDPNAYKQYLVQNVPGFDSSSASAVVRKLNTDSLCQSLFSLAGTLCLTLKAQQFYVLCILAWPLQLFSHPCIGICCTSFVKVCRRMVAGILSGLNTAHGVGIGEAFYNHRFRAMVESPISCIFQYHGAGMMGSDGYIRPDRVELSQSNEEYCNSFARTCTSALGFQSPRVRYGSMNTRSLNTRAVWRVEFSGDDQVLAAVHFGSFDYNRRTQWLVMVIIKLIQKSNLPNKGAIVEFLDTINILKAAQMSMEAGVFSAMALNAFVEAQNSLHIALSLLEKAESKRNCPSQRLKAKVLHELGPIYRYQGRYTESERSLQQSLEITQPLSRKDTTVRQAVADSLHELGVLEVKKHNLDSAAQFLQRSLDLRQSLTDTESDTVNAKCAATLHQLAATYVARKPPSLEQAKALLQDALKLCRQIGQRAATLKQLARVTIRQGDLNQAEIYLEQALELYLELFGDNKMHINIASVKFQQGALALQREQWDDAWSHFSECLRIRRHVYAYAKQIGAIGTETTLTPKRKSVAETNPIHLEVSVVLHELGIVGFSQRRFSQSYQMLLEERAILENLSETTTSHSNRIYQARLTCLTWLRKCAKELDREDEAEKFTNERTAMKKEQAGLKKKETHLVSKSISLQHKVIDCRLLARQFALDKNGQNLVGKEKLLNVLDELKEEIKLAPPESMARAATQFHDTLMLWIDEPVSKRRAPILQACDSLRDILRAHGVQVIDSVSRKKR